MFQICHGELVICDLVCGSAPRLMMLMLKHHYQCSPSFCIASQASIVYEVNEVGALVQENENVSHCYCFHHCLSSIHCLRAPTLIAFVSCFSCCSVLLLSCASRCSRSSAVPGLPSLHSSCRVLCLSQCLELLAQTLQQAVQE